MPEKLRLYLDQMFRVDVAKALRDQGHDVIRASETGKARADDQQILQRAISENRILITLDEHFGDWVILPLSRHPGVIRLKVHPTTSENVLKMLIPFLDLHTQEQLKNHLVILSEKRAKWILTSYLVPESISASGRGISITVLSSLTSLTLPLTFLAIVRYLLLLIAAPP